MNKEFFFDNSHTVYFINGPLVFAQELWDKNFPDFSVNVFQYDKFGIEESRDIQQILFQKIDSKNIVCIVSPSITVEAQNSMLKILEEISHRIIFFVFTGSVTLLPTVLSRGCLVEGYNKKDENMITFASDFLQATIYGRQKIVEQKSKDLENRELRVFISAFLENLNLIHIHDTLFIKNNAEFILDAHRFLAINKMSPKQIFEFLAVSLKK